MTTNKTTRKVNPTGRRKGLIAVEPDNWRKETLVSATEKAGGTVCPPEQATALIWAAPEQPELLPDYIRDGHDWVQLPFAGIEPFIDMLDNQRLWSCGKGVYASAVAEHALAMILALKRGIVDYSMGSSWGKPLGTNLFGSRVLILGGGGITEELIPMLRPFKCSISVLRKSNEALLGCDQILTLEDLDIALPETDILVVALALTSETEGVVNKKRLDLLPSGAIVVNVARGKHIITSDLVDALIDNEIAGAGLDVTEPEPLPDDHALWALPNCLITPHTGNTPEMGIKLLANRVEENVVRYIAGEPILGCVDISAGY
ncbi:MAG: D-isomer specific 2-hydroxyacid dehydrogenase family protein [Acidimicrobiales bacterium]|nr:D-isomer specific 2-hydroxyacid dehydrogenase family protein [Acidimicrobiales bacterium]MDP6298741.1 D-isomer specific 2-hydroxyacid dehydrogenase family protein [Acidimicrobiales bacterium]HJM28022.1 D-isomer specific 2-hydroxyacid dehydrogenase family protein [Acidimicrobiales bacterium]HJM96631.1 D-isomer specific 2-hydroxyacid dehydrogenase family protein [Acidimicrobiales bacterium]